MVQLTAKTPVVPSGATTAPAGNQPHIKRRLEPWIPYVLALLFFASALRGVGGTDVIDTDAARHAMNGAFIYDLLRSGHWMNPVEYAKAYYAQYPALSMPFHPPLFPAIEALFFALFGVTLLSARVAVAVAVAVCAILLYRLASATLGRPLVAAGATIATLSIWTVQFVARDVMLEFPAMVFTLAAVYCLRDLDRSYTMRRALLFALFAAAAAWTKQHAVFLGAVPVIHAVLARRWHRFVQAPLWVSSTLFGAAVLALLRSSQMFQGTVADQMITSPSDFYWIFTTTIPGYFKWTMEALRGMPGIFAACAAGAYAWGLRKRDSERPKVTLYVAWVLAICGLLMDLGGSSPRYLFFLFPAVMAVGYAWLFHGCRWLWGERRANWAVAAFTAAWFVTGLFIPMDFLRGPAAAAQTVVTGERTRVLYAGAADGNFIFAVRTLDPKLQVTVIPAGKLRDKIFEETTVQAFCERYGIEWLVFEDVPERQSWSKFHAGIHGVGTLVRRIPLASTRTRWQRGTIEVYRVPVMQTHPGGVLQLPISTLGGSVPLQL